MSFTADTISGVDPFATPLRVLHVLQPTEAGVWRYASDMAQFQSDHGWQVHVASPVRPDADVPWLQWQAVRNPAKGVRDESRRLRGIVGQVRPDAVVAHSSKAGLVVRSTVRGTLPTVFLPHAWSFAALGGPVAIAARQWEKAAAAWTNAVVCVGEGEARTGVAAGIRAPFFLVPNPVPPHWLTGTRRPLSDLGLAAAPDVVFVGRLSEQKGVEARSAGAPGCLALDRGRRPRPGRARSGGRARSPLRGRGPGPVVVRGVCADLGAAIPVGGFVAVDAGGHGQRSEHGGHRRGWQRGRACFRWWGCCSGGGYGGPCTSVADPPG